jgi:hypothetical protein
MVPVVSLLVVSTAVARRSLRDATPAFSMMFFNSSFSVARHAAAAYRARRSMSDALVSMIARRSATAS